MLSGEERQKAKARASLYAPAPKLLSSEATVRALIFVGFPLAFFMGLSGLNADDFGIPIVITLAIAGGGTYFYFKRLEDKHYAALDKEEQNIIKQRGRGE